MYRPEYLSKRGHARQLREIAATGWTDLSLREKLLLPFDCLRALKDADRIDTRRGFKLLGLLCIAETPSRVQVRDRDNDIYMRNGVTPAIELGLTPIPNAARTREAMDASLSLVASYMVRQQLNVMYVYGITYNRMAEFAHRQFGFTTMPLDRTMVHPAIAEETTSLYQRYVGAGRSLTADASPTLIVKNSADFVDHHM